VAFDPAGTPLRIALSSQDVLQAIHPMMREILDLIVCTLDQLPPELWVEVIESGISLAGGGACLRGIDRLVARATSAEVKLAPNPLRATIEGAGEILAAARQAGLWDTLW
jgi:rod shape-determining protein MreB